MDNNKITKLVISAQKGDSDALNQLFNATYNDIYYFALKTLKDEDLACDITQETFVAIINNLNSLKEPAAFMGWAKKIAYSQCTRYFNKKKDVLVEEDEDGNSIFDTIAEDKGEFIPDKALDQAEFKNTIHGILNILSEEQRSAVMMFYFDEMSVREIAEIQNVSEGTVKSRLNYARKTIKNGVEEYEKKHDIKLHAIPFFPFFGWLFKDSFQNGMPMEKAVDIAANIQAKSGVKLAIGKSVTGSTAVSGSAVATASVNKTALSGVGAKIIAGVLAAVLVVGGVVAAITLSSHRKEDENGEKSGKDKDKTHETSHNLDNSDASDKESAEGFVIPQCGHLAENSTWQLASKDLQYDSAGENGFFQKSIFCETCGDYCYEEISIEKAVELFATDVINSMGFPDNMFTPTHSEIATLCHNGIVFAPKWEAKDILDENGNVLYEQLVCSTEEFDGFAKSTFGSYPGEKLEYNQENMPTDSSQGWVELYSQEDKSYIFVRKPAEKSSEKENYEVASVTSLGDPYDDGFAVEIAKDGETQGYMIIKSGMGIFCSAIYRGDVPDWQDWYEDLVLDEDARNKNISAVILDDYVVYNDNMPYYVVGDNQKYIINSNGDYVCDTETAVKYEAFPSHKDKQAFLAIKGNGEYSVSGIAQASFSGIEGEYVGVVLRNENRVELYTFKDGKLLYSRCENGEVTIKNLQLTIVGDEGVEYSEFTHASFVYSGNWTHDLIRLVTKDNFVLVADFPSQYTTDESKYPYCSIFKDDGRVMVGQKIVGMGGFAEGLQINSELDMGYIQTTDTSYYKVNYEYRQIELPEGYTVSDLKYVLGDSEYCVFNDGNVYNLKRNELLPGLSKLYQQGKIAEFYTSDHSYIYFRMTNGFVCRYDESFHGSKVE